MATTGRHNCRIMLLIMNPLQNVSLKLYSTMRLGGTAAYLLEITDRFQIQGAVAWAKERNLPVLMIGGGSNIVWKDEGFQGLLLVNKIQRYEVFEEDQENVYVTAGAGEVWDSVVGRTVEQGLSGIEQLSLVPGSTGATPVQNVGAYGREMKDVLVSVEAFDLEANQLTTIPAIECAFSYRTSRFRTTDRGKFFITAITMHLSKLPPRPPFYASLTSYFDQHPVEEYTSQAVRDAVIAIRTSKLPDPAKVANNGSFFYNPIIGEWELNQLLADYPGLVYWKQDDGQAKLSAAWLVEQAGFKDIHDQETGMATWPSQSLVFINEHAQSTAQLLQFKQKIVDAVKAKFDVTLEQEPELLP
jgi:UDP-N-acetylmuramate dehydrogenase